MTNHGTVDVAVLLNRRAQQEPVWSKIGSHTLKLKGSEAESFAPGAIYPNITTSDAVPNLYREVLERKVKHALCGVNVSLVFLGSSTETPEIFLALCKNSLRTIVTAPDAAERYCSAAALHITPDNEVLTIRDTTLRKKRNVNSSVLHTSLYGKQNPEAVDLDLWHTNHGLFASHEDYQELSCAQDLHHFFTSFLATENVPGADEKYEAESRETGAILIVVEILQAIEQGRDARSTLTLAYIPQLSDKESHTKVWQGNPSRHLIDVFWSSMESLVEHGTLDSKQILTPSQSTGILTAPGGTAVDSENKDFNMKRPLHAIEKLCSHILLGGGLFTTIVSIANESRSVGMTLNTLRHLTTLRDARLYVSINYSRVLARIRDGLGTFPEYAQSVQARLRHTYASGVAAGWRGALSGALRFTSLRRNFFRASLVHSLVEVKEKATVQLNAIAKTLFDEYCTHRLTQKEVAERKNQLLRVLEQGRESQDILAKCQKDLDTIRGDRKRTRIEYEHATSVNAEALALTNTRKQHWIDAVTAAQEKSIRTREDEIEHRAKRQKHMEATEASEKEHAMVHPHNFVQDVERKTRTLHQLRETYTRARSLGRDLNPSNDPLTGQYTQESEKMTTELSLIHSRVAGREHEVRALSAQLRAFGQKSLSLPLSSDIAMEHASYNHSVSIELPERSAEVPPPEMDSGFSVLHNISMLIEQSPSISSKKSGKVLAKTTGKNKSSRSNPGRKALNTRTGLSTKLNASSALLSTKKNAFPGSSAHVCSTNRESVLEKNSSAPMCITDEALETSALELDVFSQTFSTISDGSTPVESNSRSPSPVKGKSKRSSVSPSVIHSSPLNAHSIAARVKARAESKGSSRKNVLPTSKTELGTRSVTKHKSLFKASISVSRSQKRNRSRSYEKQKESKRSKSRTGLTHQKGPKDVRSKNRESKSGADNLPTTARAKLSTPPRLRKTATRGICASTRKSANKPLEKTKKLDRTLQSSPTSRTLLRNVTPVLTRRSPATKQKEIANTLPTDTVALLPKRRLSQSQADVNTPLSSTQNRLNPSHKHSASPSLVATANNKSKTSRSKPRGPTKANHIAPAKRTLSNKSGVVEASPVGVWARRHREQLQEKSISKVQEGVSPVMRSLVPVMSPGRDKSLASTLHAFLTDSPRVESVSHKKVQRRRKAIS